MFFDHVITCMRGILRGGRRLHVMPLVFALHGARLAAQTDSSHHHVRFVTVAPDVRLEVLDWGGSGPPLVLLAGLGNTAHVFDGFAPKLATLGHVFGITRRGIGASSHPDSGYDANELADDVLAVLDSVNISGPVLIGSSLAGEELSSIGSREPARVAGLVYLDAAYYYAFYDSTRGNLGLELLDLQRKIDRLQGGPVADYRELSALSRHLAEVDLPRAQRSLRAWARTVDSLGPRSMLPRRERPSISQKIHAGAHLFTHVDAPVMAIYAAPHRETPPALRASDSASVAELGASFRRAVPDAHIIMLRNESHLVWQSNEAEVFDAIRRFVRTVRH